MEIRKVEVDKKQHLDLLLLADDGVEAECVVTDEGGRHPGAEKHCCGSGQGIWKSHGRLSHPNLYRTVYSAAGGHRGQPLYHPIL